MKQREKKSQVKEAATYIDMIKYTYTVYMCI